MTHPHASRRILAFILVALLQFTGITLHAQAGDSTLSGTIADSRGIALANAAVTITNTATKAEKVVHTDNSGLYTANSLPAGTYTVQVSASGFSPISKSDVVLAPGQTQQLNLSLSIGAVVEEVTVNAGVDSMAVKEAPSGGYLEERSAQSLVSNHYIENFTSPVADYGELVQIVPGAFTTSSDGVGLGQSKTYFRGFPDGDYNVDFDGIPFYDTNTPTHHSWSFFPVQWIGGVDFDRSPGSAITIGPTPFGGSIHFLSKPLIAEQDYRASVSYGTWNTKLYDGEYNSGNFGLFGGAAKSNMYVDVNHMTSDGYQSFNANMRTAGSILYQYTFSPKTVITGFSGVVHLDANAPNISSTRCMLYGAQTGYSCSSANTANGLLPYTDAGIKFLLTNNANSASWFDQQYNAYQVYTDFEYVNLKSQLTKRWYLEFKPYTLNYDNGELYSNATPITEYSSSQVVANPSLLPGAVIVGTGSKATAYYEGTAVAPCDVQVTKKSIAALPCGIDKYNSYRKYGENVMATQTTGFGVFRAGFWYEWARTNRHQYPSDPLNNWADQPLPKFNEQFWTNSYQPYAEYEFHVTKSLNVTAGTKFAAYTIDVFHHADDGSTVGELSCYPNITAACSATAENHGNFTAWLPSLDANYRILPNWSVFAQAALGSIVPPSSVYDYGQTAASASAAVPQLATPPKQQKSTTYEIGTVYKANKISFDADAFRVRFQNSYSSTVDNIPGDVDQGDTIYYLQPSSITEGFEFETTAVLQPGLSLYLNGTVDNAYYEGTLNASTSQTAPINEAAPGGLWVQQTPTDTEMEGLTYSKSGFDVGLFNKRVGTERLDNGQYHNQADIPQFSSLGGYFNYTVNNHSIFDQTKIRLSATNLIDSHTIQSNTLAGSPNTIYLNSGAACTAPTASNPCDAFRTNGMTPINAADTPAPMAGRSFSVSVTFGFAPERKK